jgi:hypothetical protein
MLKIFSVLALITTLAMADTPPPGAVKIKDASGNLITSTNNSGKQSLDVNVTTPGGLNTVNQGTAAAASGAWPMYICNSGGSHCMSVNSDGSLNVDATVSNPSTNYALETGGNLAAIYAKLLGSIAVTGTFFQSVQPISVSSLPLPSNASQESGGHLAAIDLKIPSLGQALAASSVPVVLTAAQIATLTPLSSVAISNPATNYALESGGHLASIDAKLTSPLTTNSTLQSGSNNIGHVDGQGTPGSPSGGVVSVQGVSGGQALPVSGTVTSIPSGSQTVIQPTPSLLNATVVTTGGVTIAKDSSLTTINTTLGSPFQAGGSIGNTAFQANAGTNLNTSALALSATQTNGTQTTQINNGANTAAVKAASTAAVATDPALVVAISPNNTPVLPSGASTLTAQNTGNTSLASILSNQTNSTQISQVFPSADTQPSTQNITAQDLVSTSTTGANNQKFVTGTPTAGSAASFAISTIDNVRIQVTGSWTGTLVTEVSMDGTNWFSHGIKQTGASQTASSFTANFAGHMNVVGLTNVRVRASATWTGTASVLISKSYNLNAVSIASTVKSDDTEGSGTITTTTPVSLSVGGASTLTLTTTGTWTASIQLLGSNVLGATTGQPLWFRQVSGNDMNVFAANATYCIDTAGFNTLVISPASFSSGSLSYTYNAGQGGNKNCGSGSQLVSLGNSNKTPVMKTAELSTTATTANQVILTYTVTAGKTYYVQYFKCTANTQAAAVTATAFGSCSLSINGTVVYTDWLHGDGANNYPIGEQFSEAIPVSSGQTILIETTPAAATAFFWYGNFGGFER